MIFVASESVPSLKICKEACTPVFQRTQKPFVEIPLGLCFIKIINYFNIEPKSKIREIKQLMGINKIECESSRERRSSQVLILAIDSSMRRL